MTRTFTLSALILAVAAPAFASAIDVAKRHAAENDDRQVVRFLENGGTNGDVTTFSSRGTPSVSALEVALQHAIENDERAKANYLRAQLGQ